MRGYRIGVVNPKNEFGEAVRELLAEQRLPTIEMKLFEAEATEESTLTQFRDEVVVTQPLDADLLPRLDALFVSGEDGDLLNRIAMEAARAGVLTLVHGAVGLEAPVVASASHAGRLDGSERIAIVPRASSYAVGQVLGRLAERTRLRGAAATILLPARERGEPGAEELHQQTVNLLNFKPMPTAVFGEQMAFNVQRAAGAVADSIAAEIEALSGAKAPVQVQLAHVPVFHGYAASIWVDLDPNGPDGGELDLDELRLAFRRSPFVTAKRSGQLEPSPVGIEDSKAIHVGTMRSGRLERGAREDGGSSSGLWLWVVADRSSFEPAEAAIEVAKAALE